MSTAVRIYHLSDEGFTPVSDPNAAAWRSSYIDGALVNPASDGAFINPFLRGEFLHGQFQNHNHAHYRFPFRTLQIQWAG